MFRRNSVLLTGMALYRDADPGDDHCIPCNFDFEWMFRYPSTFLWADRILVTPTIAEAVQSGHVPGLRGRQGEAIGQTLKVVFDAVGEAGLLDIRNPAEAITPGLLNLIGEQIVQDLERLNDMFPQAIALDKRLERFGGFSLRGHHFCTPRLYSLYVSFALARMWKARLLLEDDAREYLKYLVWSRDGDVSSARSRVTGFRSVLRTRIPEPELEPWIGPEECWTCGQLGECDAKQIRKFDESLRSYLQVRDYDEIAQLRECFDKVADTVEQLDSEASTADVVQRFKSEERRLQRRIGRFFPKVKRWTALGTVVSIPLAVAGASLGSELATGLGAAGLAISQVAEKYVDLMSSKHRWVCFKRSTATAAVQPSGNSD